MSDLINSFHKFLISIQTDIYINENDKIKLFIPDKMHQKLTFELIQRGMRNNEGRIVLFDVFEIVSLDEMTGDEIRIQEACEHILTVPRFEIITSRCLQGIKDPLLIGSLFGDYLESDILDLMKEAYKAGMECAERIPDKDSVIEAYKIGILDSETSLMTIEKLTTEKLDSVWHYIEQRKRQLDSKEKVND